MSEFRCPCEPLSQAERSVRGFEGKTEHPTEPAVGPPSANDEHAPSPEAAAEGDKRVRGTFGVLSPVKYPRRKKKKPCIH